MCQSKDEGGVVGTGGARAMEAQAAAAGAEYCGC